MLICSHREDVLIMHVVCNVRRNGLKVCCLNFLRPCGCECADSSSATEMKTLCGQAARDWTGIKTKGRGALWGEEERAKVWGRNRLHCSSLALVWVCFFIRMSGKPFPFTRPCQQSGKMWKQLGKLVKSKTSQRHLKVEDVMSWGGCARGEDVHALTHTYN